MKWLSGYVWRINHKVQQKYAATKRISLTFPCMTSHFNLTPSLKHHKPCFIYIWTWEMEMSKIRQLINDKWEFWTRDCIAQKTIISTPHTRLQADLAQICQYTSIKWTKKRLNSRTEKLSWGYMAGLTSSVTKNNYTGWTDYKSLMGHALVYSFLSKGQFSP